MAKSILIWGTIPNYITVITILVDGNLCVCYTIIKICHYTIITQSGYYRAEHLSL